MRLNVAASSLLLTVTSLETSAAPASSSSSSAAASAERGHRQRKLQQKKKFDGIDIASFLSQDLSFVKHKFRSSKKKNKAQRGNRKKQERFILEKLLTNNDLIVTGKQKKECDPSSSLSSSSTTSSLSDDADVGILGCGLHQYCRESDDSSLGGYCTNTNVVVLDKNKNKKFDKDRTLQETPADTSPPATNETTATVIDQARKTCELVETIDELNCQICEFDEDAYTGKSTFPYPEGSTHRFIAFIVIEFIAISQLQNDSFL